MSTTKDKDKEAPADRRKITEEHEGLPGYHDGRPQPPAAPKEDGPGRD